MRVYVFVCLCVCVCAFVCAYVCVTRCRQLVPQSTSPCTINIERRQCYNRRRQCCDKHCLVCVLQSSSGVRSCRESDPEQRQCYDHRRQLIPGPNCKKHDDNAIITIEKLLHLLQSIAPSYGVLLKMHRNLGVI